MAGLYIHIPFCKQRCIYCDFYFVTSQAHVTAFLETLKAEIAFWGRRLGPEESIETIYFGGGTPSLLSPNDIRELMDAFDAAFDISNTREVSFELNPDDVDLDYLHALKQTGVNRLSIGIQSFFDDDLKWMNRAHSAAESRAIILQARTAGFENFSIDLIFGLPHQTDAVWSKNLETALTLDPPHLSTYSLTIEPQTPLHKRVNRGIDIPASDGVLAQLYQATMDRLRDAAYEHYEVSSFARPGFRSQHNQLYWRHANYLGLGPSAHSFWRSALQGTYRWANARSLKQYVAWNGAEIPPLYLREAVTPEDLANEYIMLRLRTRDGLDLNELEMSHGVSLSENSPAVRQVLDAGFAELKEDHTLCLTDKGMLVCDAITQRLMS